MSQSRRIRRVWISFHSSFTQKSLDLRFLAAPLVVVLSDRQLSFLPATSWTIATINSPKRTVAVSAHAIDRGGLLTGDLHPSFHLNCPQYLPTMTPIPNSVEASPTHPTFHSTKSGIRRIGLSDVRVVLQKSMSFNTSNGAFLFIGLVQEASHRKLAVK